MDKESLLVILILILMVVLVVAILYMRTEGAKCMASPIPYGISKIEDKVGVDLSCYCNGGVQINATSILIKENPLGE